MVKILYKPVVNNDGKLEIVDLNMKRFNFYFTKQKTKNRILL